MKALVSRSLGVRFLGAAFGISISVKMAGGALFPLSPALNRALTELQSSGCDKTDQGMDGSGLIILLWWTHLLFFCLFFPHCVLDSDCISTKGKILLENYKYFPGYPIGVPCSPALNFTLVIPSYTTALCSSLSSQHLTQCSSSTSPVADPKLWHIPWTERMMLCRALFPASLFTSEDNA